MQVIVLDRPKVLAPLLRDDRTRLLLIHFSFRITLPVSAT